MKRTTSRPGSVRTALALVMATVTNAAAQANPNSAAIDAQVWKPVAASVANDDIAAMGRTYHPDAILVMSSGTRRISEALAGWGKDMVTNKAAGIKATVEFRFTKRQDDAETAFETGAFKYTTIDKAGKATPRYIKMEALLVKTGGKWLMIMERQLEAIDEAAWNAMPR
jgi:ketosteroid isomerase-like protein